MPSPSSKCALLLLFAAAHLAAQTPTGAIHGKVKDAVTGDPLPGAHVTISTSGGFIRSQFSDDDGDYSLASIPSGAVTISVQNSRRTTVTSNVQLNGNDDLTVDIPVPPNATISGRVVNADKQPQAKVPVWVVQNEVVHGIPSHTLMGPQVTAPDGTYKFDAFLPIGRKFYLVAERNPAEEVVTAEPKPLDQREPIEAPTYFGDTITLDAATHLLLEPAEQRPGIDIKIRKAADFCADGTVSLDGKRASALVTVYERALAGTSLFRLNAISADDGTFRVCGLTSGQYLLATNNPKGLSGEEEFIIGDSDIHNLRLFADAASLHLTVVYDGDPPPAKPAITSLQQRPGSVTFRYSDGTERSLSQEELSKLPISEMASNRISVNLMGLRNRTSLAQTVNGPFDGLYSKELGAGDYSVEVGLNPGCCYVKAMSYNGVLFTDHLLHLAPNTSGTLRVLLSADGGTLTCTRPQASTVMLFPASGPRISVPNTGVCRWQNLPPGKYRILAVPRPLQLPEEDDKLTELLSQAQEVEIEAKLTRQVTLEAITVK